MIRRDLPVTPERETILKFISGSKKGIVKTFTNGSDDED
jgi:hypothetical protein